jgi:hypothetical protein
MNTPLEFYTQQKTEFENEASSLKKKLVNVGILRLLFFQELAF